MGLRCNKHARYSKKLKLIPYQFMCRQVSVNIVYSKIQGVRNKFVLFRNLHQPINQNCSHDLVYIILNPFHVVRQRSPSCLNLVHKHHHKVTIILQPRVTINLISKPNSKDHIVHLSYQIIETKKKKKKEQDSFLFSNSII